MGKQKNFLKNVIHYYETSKDVLHKQASAINKYEAEKVNYIEKVADYIDSCVERGSIPDHLSDVMKLDLSNNPSKFVDLMSKSGSFLDINANINTNTSTHTMGKASSFESKSDPFEEWVFNR